MELRLNRVEFLNELVPMQGVAERRTTIPVLSHLLLRTGDRRLHLAATDLEVSLTSWCAAEVQEEGAIAIQAKKLVEIIRASTGDDVTLRIDQDGFMTISVGRSLFKIRGLPHEDFPTLPSIDDEQPMRVPFAAFRRISRIFFMSRFLLK